MAEPTQYLVSFREFAELVVRREGLEKGHWGVYVEFAIHAGNIGVGSPAALHPAAIIPIKGLGIQRFDEPNELTVDASEIAGQGSGRAKKKTAKKKTAKKKTAKKKTAKKKTAKKKTAKKKTAKKKTAKKNA